MPTPRFEHGSYDILSNTPPLDHGNMSNQNDYFIYVNVIQWRNMRSESHYVKFELLF